MKILSTILLTLTTFINFAQGNSQTNTLVKGETKLNSLIAIDNIIRIKVTNIHGTHILTERELAIMKGQLKSAKYAGGLMVKPGHIWLSIELKDKVIKSFLVYATIGEVHFANVTSKNNTKFSGTFIMPSRINFDNFK